MASKNQGRVITFAIVLVAFFGGIYLSKMVRESGKDAENRPSDIVKHTDVNNTGGYKRSEKSPVIDKKASTEHVSKDLYKKEEPKFRINKKIEPIFGNMTELKEQPLSAFKGQMIVVNIWTVHCQYCVKEIPSFLEMSKELSSDKLRFMSISVDTNEALARKFLKDNKFVVEPLYMDTRRTLRRRYDTRQLPMTLIIGPDGKTLATIKIPVNWNSKKSRAVIQKYMDKSFPKKKAGN